METSFVDMEFTVKFLLDEQAAGRLCLSQDFTTELRSKSPETFVIMAPYQGKYYCFYLDSEEEAKRIKDDVPKAVDEWYRLQNLKNPFSSKE